MKIRSKVVNASGEEIAPDEVTTKAPEKIAVVYAHTDEVNDNGLKLNADSLIVTRDKYPLLYEHSDNSIDNVVGYVETDGKPNNNGEFVGYITFYDTPNGQHARQLWQDGTWKITKPEDAPTVYCTVEDLTYYHSVPAVIIDDTVYFGDMWNTTPEEWLEKNKDALNKRYGFEGYNGTAYDTADHSVRVTIVDGAEVVPADQKFVKVDSAEEIPE